MKKAMLMVLLKAVVLFALAQDEHPVSWKFDVVKMGPLTFKVQMHATVKAPYHIYPQQASGGIGMPTSIVFSENANLEFTGGIEEKGVEPVGEEGAAHYAKGVTFSQAVKLRSDEKTTVQFRIKYMACTDQMCLPPASRQFSIVLNDKEGPVAGEESLKATTDTAQLAMKWKYEDFLMPDVSGNLVATKTITTANKYTFIDFWASWCAPCRVQARALLPLYKKYSAQGLGVIAVSLDTDAKAWKKAIADDGYTWTNLSDMQGFDSPLSKKYGITAIPRNFLLNNKGEIIAVDLHGKALEEKLKALFDQ